MGNSVLHGDDVDIRALSLLPPPTPTPFSDFVFKPVTESDDNAQVLVAGEFYNGVRPNFFSPLHIVRRRQVAYISEVYGNKYIYILTSNGDLLARVTPTFSGDKEDIFTPIQSVRHTRFRKAFSGFGGIIGLDYSGTIYKIADTGNQELAHDVSDLYGSTSFLIYKKFDQWIWHESKNANFVLKFSSTIKKFVCADTIAYALTMNGDILSVTAEKIVHLPWNKKVQDITSIYNSSNSNGGTIVLTTEGGLYQCPSGFSQASAKMVSGLERVFIEKHFSELDQSSVLACARNGDVYVWGRGDESQLGTGSFVYTVPLTIIKELNKKRIIDVQFRGNHTFVVLDYMKVPINLRKIRGFLDVEIKCL